MAHEKLSPRQKMIGMMYLVLTAMLALNVSKEAVEAFKNIEKGLSLTIKNYSLKNNLIYEEFEKSFAQYPEKTRPYRTKALQVKERADELFDYLQGLKVEIVTTREPKNTLAVQGNEVNSEEIKIIDDNNIPSQILIGPNDDQKAFFLRTMIDDYRTFLINDILQGENPTVEEALKQSLNTDDVRNHRTQEMEKWANHNFQALPLIYVITMLSKIQVDVRNSETEVINHLFAQIDKSNFKFNKVGAVVIPKSTYITLGSSYEASVFVSATDSTQAPDITVSGGQKLPLDDSGKGIYSVKPSKTGTATWGGVIALKAPDGTIRTFDFKDSYYVGEPNVVVSLTAMNVMYQGIPNPIDVSVPGVTPDKVSIKVLANGSFSLEKVKNARGENFGGNFAIKPNVVGQPVQIQILSTENGRVTNHGIKEFRVKRVPTPEARLGLKGSGKIPLSEARIQSGLRAEMPDFDFDLQYTVTGFTLLFEDKMGTFKRSSTSNALTAEQKDILQNRLTKGKSIVFTDITAKDPYGKVVPLNPLVLEIE